jgi:DNA-binding beta-propeller fold protein YncE
VNSVAVYDGLVALAIEANPKTSPGAVAFYNAADLRLLHSVTVGALPDMVTFTPDGKYLLVAG